MLKLNVIVVPTDFSERSLAALDHAVGLAERYDARVQVIFVNEPGLKISDLAWVGIDERAMEDDRLAGARRHSEKLLWE